MNLVRLLHAVAGSVACVVVVPLSGGGIPESGLLAVVLAGGPILFVEGEKGVAEGVGGEIDAGDCWRGRGWGRGFCKLGAEEASMI